MEQLILHLLGDYVIQNNWMANNKEKHTFPCLIHCLTYALPFLLITNWQIVSMIGITHFMIDRTGIGKNFKTFGPNTPEHVKFFVSVAVDNTFHLICNYLLIGCYIIN